MDKFNKFSNSEDSLSEFLRYKKPDEIPKGDFEQQVINLLTRQTRLLELLIEASEKELVPLRYNSGLQNIPVAVFNKPTDPDNTDPNNGGYTVIDIRTILERRSPELYLQNEGPGTMFVRVLKSKNDTLTEESVVFEGEYDVYYDVFELRIRVSTANTKYRISEYEPGKHRDIKYKRGLSYVSETSVAVSGTPNIESIVTDPVKGLGRFATTGYLACNGPGNILLNVSIDGTNYGTTITILPNEEEEFEDELYSLKIDATINNTAYRLNVH